jgi:hypothetical protein
MDIKPLHIALGVAGVAALAGVYIIFREPPAPALQKYTGSDFYPAHAIKIQLGSPTVAASVPYGASVVADGGGAYLASSTISSSNAAVLAPVEQNGTGFVAVGKGTATLSGVDLMGKPVSATVLVA